MRILSGVLGAGANLIGNILGHKSNKDTNANNYKIAQMNNEYNYKMFQEQLAYNTRMWHEENRYNTASAQAERLRAAGLNPALVMNGSNAGTAGSAGGVNPPTASPVQMQPFQPDFSGFASSLQNMVVNRQNQEQLQNDRERIKIDQFKALGDFVQNMADVRNKDMQTEGQKLLNQFNRDTYHYRMENYRFDVELKKVQQQNILRQSALLEVQEKIANKQLGYMDEKHQMEMSEVLSRIALNYANRDNAKENKRKIAQEIKNLTETEYGIKLTNAQSLLLTPYVIRSAINASVPTARQSFFQRANGNPMQTFFDGIETVLKPYIPFAK